MAHSRAAISTRRSGNMARPHQQAHQRHRRLTIAAVLSFENFALVTLLAIGLWPDGKASKTKTLPLTISILNLLHAFFTRRHTSIIWKLLPLVLVCGLAQKNLNGVDAMLEDRIAHVQAWLTRFDANHETDIGGTSLIQVLACQPAGAPNQPYTRSVNLLLQRGSRIDFQRVSDQATALMLAANEGNIAMVKLLLKKGADKRLRDVNGKTALNYARAPHVISFGGWGPGLFPQWATYWPFRIAPNANHSAIVKLLGFTDQLGPDGFHLLHHAAISGDLATVIANVDGGVDVDLLDSDGWTALMRACLWGHVDVVEALLSRAARTDAQAHAGGGTALIFACLHGPKVPPPHPAPRWNADKALAVVQMLLKHGARPDQGNWKHETPLMIARQAGAKEIVRLLQKQTRS